MLQGFSKPQSEQVYCKTPAFTIRTAKAGRTALLRERFERGKERQLTWLAKAAVAILLAHADSVHAWGRDAFVEVMLAQGSGESGSTVTTELRPIACACAPILTWRRGARVGFFLARFACVT
jgi:hypothetical protein